MCISTVSSITVLYHFLLKRSNIDNFTLRPAPMSCCKGQKSDVPSDHQLLCVNYVTAVYTSKERLHNKNEVAYCNNNNVMLFNTEHGFIENKNIARCSSKYSANFIHYWSCLDCQVKNTDYVSILPFRLLRDQCYRADSSIHKPKGKTPASVLSPVRTYSCIN